ncbi:MAG: hypothetical protein QXD04_00120 [Candidatus Bathyarchaeia archaeon]|nr:hypothetical protein [Candidatus Bathyarchaeota archaeon]
MSRERELIEILEKALPFPPKVILGYANLNSSFTSGDLARICGISTSSAKFYLGKMVELRMVTRIPHRKRYQKYSNAKTFSSWLRDLIKLALVPLESGILKIPDEAGE